MYAPSYFDPYTSIVYLILQLILVYGVLGEDSDQHHHVFKSFYWHTKLKVFNVKAHVFCIIRAQYAAPQYFRCGNVRRSCCQFPRVYDRVSSCGDADLVGVFFPWMIVHNYVGICYHFIIWYLMNLIRAKYNECICPFCSSSLIALR